MGLLVSWNLFRNDQVADKNSTGIYVIHHPGAGVAQGVKI
jgi:hypothetical protein